MYSFLCIFVCFWCAFVCFWVYFCVFMFFFLCVCVCHTLWQREAGGQPREHSRLPNEEGYATTDMETDHLHVPAQLLELFRYVPLEISGCFRRSSGSSWLLWSHTCYWPSIPSVPRAWLKTSRSCYMDTCIHHTSVSSPVDFRKPRDGTAPGVIPARQGNTKPSPLTVRQMRISYPFLFLALALSFCLFLPVRTCTRFLFVALKFWINLLKRMHCQWNDWPKNTGHSHVAFPARRNSETQRQTLMHASFTLRFLLL